jgi:hypothetical protein
MKSLVGVLDMIRQQPGLYLPARTLECLRAYIEGWRLAADYPEAEEALLVGFQQWIADRFLVKSAQSWDSIILFYAKDGHDALNQFFVLFAEYMAARSGSEEAARPLAE